MFICLNFYVVLYSTCGYLHIRFCPQSGHQKRVHFCGKDVQNTFSACSADKTRCSNNNMYCIILYKYPSNRVKIYPSSAHVSAGLEFLRKLSLPFVPPLRVHLEYAQLGFRCETPAPNFKLCKSPFFTNHLKKR